MSGAAILGWVVFLAVAAWLFWPRHDKALERSMRDTLTPEAFASWKKARRPSWWL